MNKMVNITILTVRNLEKMGELFATVSAIFFGYLEPTGALKKYFKKYLVSSRLEFSGESAQGK